MADTYTQCDECRKSALTSEGSYVSISPKRYMTGMYTRLDEDIPERFLCRKCFRKYRRTFNKAWYLLGFFFLVLILLMLVKKLYTLGIL